VWSDNRGWCIYGLFLAALAMLFSLFEDLINEGYSSGKLGTTDTVLCNSTGDSLVLKVAVSGEN
jgi:hypothetical protein